MVSPWDREPEVQNYLHPSLGLHRIKSYLKEHGIVCVVFDPNLFEDPYQELKNLFGKNDFQLCGFSTNHITLPNDLSLLHWMHEFERGMFLMIGGIEATFNYQQVLQFSPEGVMLVRGEGEPVILEFCQNPNPEEVPGLIWMEGGENIVVLKGDPN
ncbi:MAG: hypothetical protein PQ975_02220 [Methanobacterium sp.]